MPPWALRKPRLNSYLKENMKPIFTACFAAETHCIFVCGKYTHLLGQLNILKEKIPIAWKVSGSSFLSNWARWCLADTGKLTHTYEVPSQCPVKFAISLHDSQCYLSQEHNPLRQETRGPLLLSSANRCVHVPQLLKSRLAFGEELQQLHIWRREKLSAENRGGSHPPPACKASSAFVPLQMTPWWAGWFNHSHMHAFSQC